MAKQPGTEGLHEFLLLDDQYFFAEVGTDQGRELVTGYGLYGAGGEARMAIGEL